MFRSRVNIISYNNIIGKTERILIYRISEHSNKNNSACYKHTIDNKGHQMDYDNIKPSDRARNDFKLRMKELLHILKTKPELNKQLNSQSQYEIKTMIITAYEQHK